MKRLVIVGMVSTILVACSKEEKEATPLKMATSTEVTANYNSETTSALTFGVKADSLHYTERLDALKVAHEQQWDDLTHQIPTQVEQRMLLEQQYQEVEAILTEMYNLLHTTMPKVEAEQFAKQHEDWLVYRDGRLPGEDSALGDGGRAIAIPSFLATLTFERCYELIAQYM